MEITDRKGITGKGTLTVIVSPSAKIVTKVNNYNTKGTIYFYNHDTNTEVDLDDIEIQYERENDTYKSTGYLPQGTYTVYYWMCGQKVTLYKTLAVNGDTSIEATLPTGKVSGTLKDANGNSYSGDEVYVYLYRSKDIELRRSSASTRVDNDGTYSIEGVPDGQYVLVVSGYDNNDIYFETTTGTITVSGGNVTMDVKLPVANPENPPQ